MRRSRLRRAAGTLAVIALITLAFVEVALRFVPGAIPLALLQQFQPDLRAEIAARRGLPSRLTTVRLARDDGGPPLYLYAPHQLVKKPIRDAGAVTEVRMDSTGFCNPQDPPEGARAEIPLVVIGDSFTWCFGVHPNAAWPIVLGKHLRVATYNLGKDGVGPYEYIQILKKFGLKHRPRIVVMNVYEGNDLRDAVRYMSVKIPGVRQSSEALKEKVKELTRGESSFRMDRWIDWLKWSWLGRHSYAYNLILVVADSVHERIQAKLAPSARVERRTAKIDFRFTVDFKDVPVEFNGDNGDVDELLHAGALRSGDVSTESMTGALDAFAKLAAEHRFRAVLVYTPAAYTTYAGRARFRDGDVSALVEWYSRTVRDYLARESARLGIAYLDLTPGLQEAARRHAEASLYLPHNRHFTELGHAVAAAIIADWLKTSGPDK